MHLHSKLTFFIVFQFENKYHHLAENKVRSIVQDTCLLLPYTCINDATILKFPNLIHKCALSSIQCFSMITSYIDYIKSPLNLSSCIQIILLKLTILTPSSWSDLSKIQNQFFCACVQIARCCSQSRNDIHIIIYYYLRLLPYISRPIWAVFKYIILFCSCIYLFSYQTFV